ncbi:MAG: bifunctional pyr operon transcriptional regulator/uracil phosphoribosyltransferase PyrR [Candidatus Electryonea clarkiae]|nr:bifunctional pyr operon transcriptional regulator/uracil phosphoribosyltransferase PyrR [Candidatus Electryonea clarkiae]MDP8288391.1 bifunctional pyr operon transcriptional regulator/uracil phosphoribosyltransferase PyrR [Candidatus Electryonea clarkiae]
MEKIKSRIMKKADIRRTIARLAYEIVERNHGIEKLCVLGIRTRGVYVARRIAQVIKDIEGVEIPVGVLDITLYRDDYRMKKDGPGVQVTDIPFDLDGKTIVLADDVLYTGRTIRAALDALMDFGRPGRIQLAVLVDRGHRELPIKADFVGKNIPTAPGQNVKVFLNELDDKDEVFLVEEIAESGE